MMDPCWLQKCDHLLHLDQAVADSVHLWLLRLRSLLVACRSRVRLLGLIAATPVASEQEQTAKDACT